MLRSLSLAGLGVLVVLVSVTPAGAQCTGSQVFGHQLGGTLQNCADNGQVSGFVFSLPIRTIATAPSPTIDTTNTVPPGQSADFMCEADGDLSQGFGTCVGGAGIRGDGIITID